MLSRTSLALFALTLAACSPKAAGDSTDAAPPADASAAVASASSAPSAPSPRAAATAEPSAAPYLPPPETEAPSPSAAPERTKIGTFDDWVKAYEGSGEPERGKRPPRLGLVKDLAIKTGRIVFARSGDLFTFDLATGAEAQLTKKAQRNKKPVFFADGRKIAFLSNRDGGAWRVFSMNADGTDQRPITGKLREHLCSELAIAPDGGHVAYVDLETPQDWPSTRLHLIDVASGEDQSVGERDSVEDLRFSPKSDELYYVGGGFDAQRVVVVEVASKRVRRLSDAGYHLFDSPQRFGDRLLFAASLTGSYCCRASRLFTTALDGSDIQYKGPFGVAGSMNVVVSPTAKKIAVAWSVREGGFGADWRNEITILDENGIPQRALTEAFPRPFYGASSPAWAPDGKHLAFSLSLCPYVGCALAMQSVVVVDTTDPKAGPAFIAYGGGAAWSPAP